MNDLHSWEMPVIEPPGEDAEEDSPSMDFEKAWREERVKVRRLEDERDEALGLLSVYEFAWSTDSRVPMDIARDAKALVEPYRARINDAISARHGREEPER